MDLFDPTQHALTAAIGAASARQSALVANIANANTPGYVRQDLDFGQTLATAMAQGPEAIRALEPVAAPDTTALAVREDGNTVDVDRESTTLTANALQQEALVRVAKARMDILTSAMGTR